MIQIRESCFETNSSSLHSICIHKSYEMPKNIKQIHFGFGEYGWTPEHYGTIEEKASYLWTAICGSEQFPSNISRKKNRIKELLSEKCPQIDLSFSRFSYDREHKYIDIDGYVDHVEGANDFINYVLDNSENLCRYLFSKHSFIKTGNDNNAEDYPYCGVRHSPDYDVFLKGN